MEGFEVPLHRSLAEPFLMAGAPRNVTFGIVSLVILFAIPLKSLYGALFCAAFHPLAVFLTKKDPDFFNILKRHLRLKARYGG